MSGVSLLLTACGFQDYVHTSEPRSTIYIGQTAADVYENFGMPTKIERIDVNKQILIYHKQEIEKDWAYRYFHECELKFYMEDDRVADWSKKGDICAVNELSAARERSYFDLIEDNLNLYHEYKDMSGAVIAEDAFGWSAPENEKKSFFSGWFSDESEEELPAYVTEKNNRVFIGNGSTTGPIYQNNDLNYMDIPADAF